MGKLNITSTPGKNWIFIDTASRLNIKPGKTMADVGKYLVKIDFTHAADSITAGKKESRIFTVVTEPVNFVYNEFDGPVVGNKGFKNKLTIVKAGKWCKLSSIKTCSVASSSCKMGTKVIGYT